MRTRTVLAAVFLALCLLIVATLGITTSPAQAGYYDFQLVAVDPSQASVSGIDLSLLEVNGGTLDYSTEFQRGNPRWKTSMRGYIGGDSAAGSLTIEIRITDNYGFEIYSVEDYEFTSTSLPASAGTMDIILGNYTERSNTSGTEVVRRGYSGQRLSYQVVRSGGPLIPPGAVARVLSSGTTSTVGWPTAGGSLDWRPLRDGDALVSGCVILVEGEGDPQAGGGRVKIALSETFTCLVEPHSRVEILEGGLRVESGSVEASDRAPIENYNTYNDNGFCSGKDPGAAQLPFFAQGIDPVRPLVSSAAGDVRYRFETLSDGSARVSVLEGAAEVKSAKTQAKALLRAGQQITVTAQGLGPVAEKSFTDVLPLHPYHAAIMSLALKEIVNGYRVGDLWEFRPGDPVKRAQFAKMIVGAMAIPPKPTTVTRFTDLGSPDAAGYPHIFVQAAYDNGITTGTNTAQTLFAPWEPIKRAQVVTMIVRAATRLWPGVLATPPAGWSGAMSSFTDANHGANMRLAEYNGLLAGLEGFDHNWDPWKQGTRGEVAQILWNLMIR